MAAKKKAKKKVKKKAKKKANKKTANRKLLENPFNNLGSIF